MALQSTVTTKKEGSDYGKSRMTTRIPIATNRTDTAWEMKGSGTIEQVNIVFDGTKSAKKCNFSVEVDGDSIIFPSCEEIGHVHPLGRSGPTLMYTTFSSNYDTKYGYYWKVDTEFENSAKVKIHNKGNQKKGRFIKKRSNTFYRCTVIHSEK